MPTPVVEKRVGDIFLTGYSVAGEETVIAAPELNVCFDIGRAPNAVLSCDHVCLSHGHPDHSAGLHYYFTQRFFVDNEPGTVYLPASLYEPVKDLLSVWGRIEGRYTKGNVVVAEPGEDIRVRKDLVIRPFEVNHRAPTLGYAVVEVRHKLKPEFVGKTGPQLVELKKQGVSIEYNVEIPLIAYCADTAVGDFLDLDHVRNAQVLLLECTFFDLDHTSRARQGFHIHVQDLPKIMPRLRNEHIVLMHVTRRTFLRDARKKVRSLLESADLERVSFLMDRSKGPQNPST